MINGWPIAHHVFDGSLCDSATVEMLLKELAGALRVGASDLCRRPGDGDNPEPGYASATGAGYLVGLKRRRNSRSIATSKRLHRVLGSSVR
jgi:hypothetical protein